MADVRDGLSASNSGTGFGHGDRSLPDELPRGAMVPTRANATFQATDSATNGHQRPIREPSPASDSFAKDPEPQLLYSPPIQSASTETTFLKPNRLEQYSVPYNASAAPNTIEPGWIPVPLRTWFWVTFICVLVAGAIALEVALHYANVKKGWGISSAASSQTGFLHFAYTLPPAAVAMMLVAVWAWTDVEIKKLQPYVDLAHGNSPPHRSLLLDYTRTNNFIVWSSAAANKHYVVALSTIMALLLLLFQPLASSLFTVKTVLLGQPDVTIQNNAVIGLNNNTPFQDLTAFDAAAGYASASVLYSLPDPTWVNGGFAIGNFEMPNTLNANGTVTANTTGILSDPGCEGPDQPVEMDKHPDGSGWTNSALWRGCNYTWEVDKSAVNLFGVDVTTPCNTSDTVPSYQRPVVFWFFTYQPVPAASITFCEPNISLWDVTATVDIATMNLTSVTPLTPFSSASNFSALSDTVTGAPMNGLPYNGIDFNVTNPDPFTLARMNSTQVQLPGAVFLSAEQGPQGLAATFQNNGFVTLSTSVYRKYLALIAKSVYYTPQNNALTVGVKTYQSRLYLSAIAVHLLVSAMLVAAVLGTYVHLAHRADRSGLHLHHKPGTIASAVSIGAQTNFGQLVAGRQRAEELQEVLSDKRFRIDPRTNTIVMEGEEGYEMATSPNPRRSTFLLGTGMGR